VATRWAADVFPGPLKAFSLTYFFCILPKWYRGRYVVQVIGTQVDAIATAINNSTLDIAIANANAQFSLNTVRPWMSSFDLVVACLAISPITLSLIKSDPGLCLPTKCDSLNGQPSSSPNKIRMLNM